MSSASSNRLLSTLSRNASALLAPHLAPVELALRQHIERPGEDISHVYFVTSGIVSVVARSSQHDSIEAGLIGCEGMTGIAVVMANHRSPHEAFVQLEGAAQRLEAEQLRIAMRRSEEISNVLLRFAHVFSTQVTHTALANARAKIEERLARWLLMVHDRVAGDEASLTHEFIAIMLGVRRPGVTDALHLLEGKGLIRATRGVVRIVDREGLELLAGGAYGVPEREYRRLLGER
ncbi:MAG TPA: Crp/Fnr family transcriptional regulator [Vitreimonas sp.]|uniref:Crp/Fnr family transcriptional regulator n=1 Tax=Vitreimonas sp. TaxID=3069702 RepID=UPI002D3A8D56|nr:Crp/Fnr family transcriptional regulator [Vitreimonas sp.]HYD88364.1 Crp/Fnr family transcriptional regulator [Vitreimonas sp.]